MTARNHTRNYTNLTDAAVRGDAMLEPDEVMSMVRLHKSGWGAKRIAKEFQCARNTVQWYVIRYGQALESPQREKEITVAPAQISTVPRATRERLRLRHSAKAAAPTMTATSALLLVNGAMIETGSFSTPMPYAMQAIAVAQVAPIVYSNETGQEFRSLTGRLFQRFTGRDSEAKPDDVERLWV